MILNFKIITSQTRDEKSYPIFGGFYLVPHFDKLSTTFIITRVIPITIT